MDEEKKTGLLLHFFKTRQIDAAMTPFSDDFRKASRWRLLCVIYFYKQEVSS